MFFEESKVRYQPVRTFEKVRLCAGLNIGSWPVVVKWIMRLPPTRSRVRIPDPWSLCGQTTRCPLTCYRSSSNETLCDSMSL